MARQIAPKSAGYLLIVAGLVLAISPFLPWRTHPDGTAWSGTAYLELATYVVVLLGLFGAGLGLTVRGGTATARPAWWALAVGVVAGLLVLWHWLDVSAINAALGGGTAFGLVLALLAALTLVGAGLWALLGRSASDT